jgi:hypothetical protein
MTKRRRRASGTPVSFFAFQDIITSVTGILILVTLLLCLDLITVPASATQATAKTPATLPDPVQLAAQIAEAERRQPVLRQQVDDFQHLLEESGTISPLAARDELPQLRQQVEQASRGNDEAVLHLRQEKSRLETAEAELRRRNVEADTLTAEATKAGAEAKKAAKAAPIVALHGNGSGKRSIIVECRGGDQMNVATLSPDSTLIAEPSWRGGGQKALLRWASSLSSRRDYFLLMVRPDGVHDADTAIAALREAGFDVGWEPVAEGVGLFAAPDGDSH